jgi:dienelactone hydrolase
VRDRVASTTAPAHGFGMKMLLSFALLVVPFLVVVGAARAEIQTREVEYQSGGTPLQGFFAWDDAATGKRPGVLVIHEWWGHNQHARNQAIRLAKAGYVGFALDMFGKGKVTTHPADAQSFVAEATSDPARLKARFDAGLAELRRDPHVDPTKVAVIGYCFGGTVALNMARAGADVAAVITLHAGLKLSVPAEKGKIKARKILVLTGGADPMVSTEQVADFAKEMADAGADVTVISYPGAKHAFTNPDADKAGVPALAYDADADRKSWDEVVKLLNEVFGSQGRTGG